MVDAIRPLFQNLTGQVAPVERLLEVDPNEKYAIVLAKGESSLSRFDEIAFKRMQVLFSTARGILWVTRGARSQTLEANMFAGFARSLRTENAGLHIVTLDLDEQDRSPDDQICDMILRVFKFKFGPDSPNFVADTEFLGKYGVLQIPQVIENKKKDEFIVQETQSPVPKAQPFAKEGRSLELTIGQGGQLDGICFQDHQNLGNRFGDVEVEISVKSIGMNFKDVMIALGQIPFYHKIGIECSGLVTAVGPKVVDIYPGDRFCAMAQGAYANITRVSQHKVAKIPDNRIV